MAVGAIGSSFYQLEQGGTLTRGESLAVGRYTFTYQGLFERQDPGIHVVLARLAVRSGDADLGELEPERRIHRNWEQQPITGVAYRMALVAHPARPQVAYAGGHNLFLKSEDGGRTWAPVAHDLPGTDLHALAADPNEPSILYAVVSDRGLFRSDDGGSRWRLVTEHVPRTAVGLAVAPGQRGLYLATLEDGIVASVDGQSWGSANGFVGGALPTLRINAIAGSPRDHSEPGVRRRKADRDQRRLCEQHPDCAR